MAGKPDEKQIAFRKKVRIFDRRSVFFSVMVVFMFICLLILIIRHSSPVLPVSSLEEKQPGWSMSQYEKYASRLAAKGLKRQSAQAYEEYLKEAILSADQRAKICYRIAELYFDLAEYEKALAFLYRVEIEDPQTELAEKIGEKIVSCLENLGMVSQARYELQARTGLDEPQEEKGRVVIARIGQDEITLSELDAALERLQPWLRRQFSSKEGKLEFARQYVATEVLYRKAKRLGYDKDPQIRKHIQELVKQLLVQKVIEKEIKDKVKVEPADVKLYYEAHKDRYVEKARIKLSYFRARSQEEAKQILERLKNGENFSKLTSSKAVDKAEEIEEWIEENGYIPGVGSSEQIWEQIVKTEKGKFTDIIELEGNYYIFVIEDRKESRQKDFSEVKDQVEYEYRRQREQEVSQALLESVIEEQEVQIYTDRIEASFSEHDNK